MPPHTPMSRPGPPGPALPHGRGARMAAAPGEGARDTTVGGDPRQGLHRHPERGLRTLGTPGHPELGTPDPVGPRTPRSLTARGAEKPRSSSAASRPGPPTPGPLLAASPLPGQLETGLRRMKEWRKQQVPAGPVPSPGDMSPCAVTVSPCAVTCPPSQAPGEAAGQGGAGIGWSRDGRVKGMKQERGRSRESDGAVIGKEQGWERSREGEGTAAGKEQGQGRSTCGTEQG